MSCTDEAGQFVSREFAMLPSSDSNLRYTNNESVDSVWPGMLEYGYDNNTMYIQHL